MKKRLHVKIFTLIIGLMFIFATHSNIAYAKESSESAISDAEFTDLIMNGVMEKEDDAYSFTKTTVYNSLAKDSMNNRDIVQDKLIIIPVTEEGEKNLENILAARANNSTTLYQSDAAGCLTANLTIYWAVGTANNRETALLKSINGGFSAQGSGSYVGSNVYITSQEVTLGTTGFSPNGLKQQAVTYNPSVSTRSFSYNAPSSWVPVFTESEVAEVGAYYSITLTRGSSSWLCSISNNVKF